MLDSSDANGISANGRQKSNEKIAVYGGSFDPITNGHLDIITRALTIFDKVIVGVAAHPNKKTMFTTAERIELIEAALAERGIQNAQVASVTGLLADLALEVGATAFIRGLRNGVDYENEQPMVIHNRRLTALGGNSGDAGDGGTREPEGDDDASAMGIETVLLVGDPALGHISSSFIKELASYGSDISMLAPSVVVAAVQAKYERA